MFTIHSIYTTLIQLMSPPTALPTPQRCYSDYSDGPPWKHARTQENRPGPEVYY